MERDHFVTRTEEGDSSASSKCRSWGRKELAVPGPEERLASNVSMSYE